MTFSRHTMVGSFDVAALSLAAKHWLLFVVEKENDEEKDERRKKYCQQGQQYVQNLDGEEYGRVWFPRQGNSKRSE